MKILLSLILGISIFSLVISLYLERIYTPFYLNQAIDKIDLVVLLEDKIDIEYKNIKETLLNSEEFKIIVYDYAHAFVENLCGYPISYTISDEQERDLFTLYSSDFLKKYPQLSFLPTELFIDFLVERIDLNEYLPTFTQLQQQIPKEIFYYHKRLTSLTFRMICIGIILVAFLLYCFVHGKITMTGLLTGTLFSIFLLGYVSSYRWTIYLPSSFSIYEKALFVLINELQLEMKYCIIFFMGCLVLERGIYYAKKIFLF